LTNPTETEQTVELITSSSLQRREQNKNKNNNNNITTQASSNVTNSALPIFLYGETQ
jgi:hypothetical protein